MPKDDPFTEEKAYCAIQALHSVVLALIETHPDRPALAAALRSSAEKSRDYFLETKNPDKVIDQIEQAILYFATYAETHARHKS